MENLQIISEEILQSQVCSNCLQYLSVLPVIINKKGDKFCGRCSKDVSTNNKEHQKSLFNLVARQFSFKCVNQFQNCKKLLSISSVAEHEETCHYEKGECPFCSFSGNSCQIISHCVKDHPSKFAINGKLYFCLEGKYTNTFLLVKDSSVFLIIIKMTSNFLKLSIIPKFTDGYTKQHFTLKMSATPIAREGQGIMMLTDCTLINNKWVNSFKKTKNELMQYFGENKSIHCQVTEGLFDLQQEYNNMAEDKLKVEKLLGDLEKQNMFLQQKLKSNDLLLNLVKSLSFAILSCTTCKEYVSGNTLYCCLKGHTVCERCIKPRCNKCKKYSRFVSVPNLKNILIDCAWPGCTLSLELPSFPEHKRNCLQRPYKCPLMDCIKVLHSSTELLNHWHSKIVEILCTEEIVMSLEAYCHDFEYYWLINGDLYHVLVYIVENVNGEEDKLHVIIEEVDVLPNIICFTISLQHGLSDDELHEFGNKQSFSYICGKNQFVCKPKNNNGQDLFTIKLEYNISPLVE